MFRLRSPSVALVAATFLSFAAVAGEQSADFAETERASQVDLVIALDVSTSMNGLIASAKQRLWDVVNELGRAQPRPVLRVAIITYGNPAYGAQTGFVRIDQPFTKDLDAVNQTLFGFGTNGGDEYVARAVSTAIGELDWSESPNGLRILFVAGNEGAEQDPLLSTRAVMATAAGKGIVVNTIYCGSDNSSDAAGWRQVASLTNGLYAAIDQNAAAVANIATPMDDRLIELNEELNRTFIAYGADGYTYRRQQLAQDRNAGAMSPSAAASRTITKAGRLYDSSDWDMVAAMEEGAEIDDFEVTDLPAEMQAMSEPERETYVRDQAAKRQELRAEIAELDRQRRDYIADVRAREATDAEGLDEVLKNGLRTLAEEKGFRFE